MKKRDLAALSAAMGYIFKKVDYLEQALTHSSYYASPALSNERMEFLGDRVLGMTMASFLYKDESISHDQGRMASLFNYLVCQNTCHRVALSLGLQNYMLVGKSENKAALKKAILADACEALVGAVYLDSNDFETVEKCVLHMWKEPIAHVLTNKDIMTLDPKTLLQQWAQKQGLALPQYDIINRQGKAHEPTFTVRVSVDTQAFQADGPSKKEAENRAAQLFLGALGIPTCQM